MKKASNGVRYKKWVEHRKYIDKDKGTKDQYNQYSVEPNECVVCDNVEFKLTGLINNPNDRKSPQIFVNECEWECVHCGHKVWLPQEKEKSLDSDVESIPFYEVKI